MALTPTNRDNRPGYQQPTTAQRYRETPPKKENSPGVISSHTTNKDHSHGDVKMTHKIYPNSPSKRPRDVQTLPLYARRGVENFKGLACTVHQPSASPRKAAADFTGDPVEGKCSIVIE